MAAAQALRAKPLPRQACETVACHGRMHACMHGYCTHLSSRLGSTLTGSQQVVAPGLACCERPSTL